MKRPIIFVSVVLLATSCGPGSEDSKIGDVNKKAKNQQAKSISKDATIADVVGPATTEVEDSAKDADSNTTGDCNGVKEEKRIRRTLFLVSREILRRLTKDTNNIEELLLAILQEHGIESIEEMNSLLKVIGIEPILPIPGAEDGPMPAEPPWKSREPFEDLIDRLKSNEAG